MEDVHRGAIQSNYVSLVEQTDLDLMVSALYEKGVFSEQMIERYKDTQKDARQRKRQLYLDVMTRGPRAFAHLVDALTEAGYWNLVRDLDPDSQLHSAQDRPSPRPLPPRTREEKPFISISNGRTKPVTGIDPQKTNEEKVNQKPTESEMNYSHEDSKIPHFDVTKSTKYYDDDDEVSGIKAYRTRDRGRGALMVFNYTEFANRVEEPRLGADVDCVKLKYLFDEMGFTVRSYPNYTKKETVEVLESLKTNSVIVEAGCVFVVVSSHGYARAHSSDNDFRCHDGTLMSTKDFLQYFNNLHLPALEGVPKVFIFQICRGSEVDWTTLQMPYSTASDGAPYGSAPAPRPAPPPTPRDQRARVYSDILIAHSTVPGNVSYRDSKDGSWYIQVLCEVFARYAHERDVVELFTLVDQQLEERFRIQTSSIERWGFNRRLYLHPGLPRPPRDRPADATRPAQPAQPAV
ncbi:caspase Dronc [Ostrinia furnacalis]|uniref:caspase Dronc n=1 Tax=Ostrinia furnacalis TaxID=93504 RepID=UPI001038AB70|nr:caspase Dronc [Ostrinia furnacalis]